MLTSKIQTKSFCVCLFFTSCVNVIKLICHACYSTKQILNTECNFQCEARRVDTRSSLVVGRCWLKLYTKSIRRIKFEFHKQQNNYLMQSNSQNDENVKPSDGNDKENRGIMIDMLEHFETTEEALLKMIDQRKKECSLDADERSNQIRAMFDKLRKNLPKK